MILTKGGINRSTNVYLKYNSTSYSYMYVNKPHVTLYAAGNLTLWGNPLFACLDH